MKAIVLTAGPGTRLEPLTECRPKALIPVCGKSILFRLIESLAQIGIHDAAVVINPRYDGMEYSFPDTGQGKTPSVTIVPQQNASGVGQGILAARDYIDERDFFLLAYGDILAGVTYDDVMALLPELFDEKYYAMSIVKPISK